MQATAKPKGLAKIWREIKRPFRNKDVTTLKDSFKNFETFSQTGMLMILSKLTGETMLRVEGIISEYAYWESVFDRMHHPQALCDYETVDAQLRFDSEIAEPHVGILDELSQHFSIQDINILDVGAGPLTCINKIYKGIRLNITAIDALAEYYDNLLQKHGLNPPVRTVLCKGEEIAQRFPKESFHWINCRNALDHMEFPAECIKDMVTLLKPGGMISLFHWANEGLNANYTGFHQWDFFMEGNDFCIAGRNRANYVNITKTLLPNYSVKAQLVKSPFLDVDKEMLEIFIEHID